MDILQRENAYDTDRDKELWSLQETTQIAPLFLHGIVAKKNLEFRVSIETLKKN